jgi:selenophosphate synthetase-related protein
MVHDAHAATGVEKIQAINSSDITVEGSSPNVVLRAVQTCNEEQTEWVYDVMT